MIYIMYKIAKLKFSLPAIMKLYALNCKSTFTLNFKIIQPDINAKYT